MNARTHFFYGSPRQRRDAASRVVMVMACDDMRNFELTVDADEVDKFRALGFVPAVEDGPWLRQQMHEARRDTNSEGRGDE